MNRPPRPHSIKDISFVPGVPSGQAPIDCQCGWSGVLDEYAPHRAEMGEKHRVFSGVRAPGTRR